MDAAARARPHLPLTIPRICEVSSWACVDVSGHQ